MDKLIVSGGNLLSGTIPVSGSKNTALALMPAALLASGKTVLTAIPNLRDIDTLSKVLAHTGAVIDFDAQNNTLSIDATDVHTLVAPYELVRQMRASFYMLGALLGRGGKARVSLPGGCAWGPRPVDLHLKGLEALGAKITVEQGDVIAEAEGGRLRGGLFRFEPSSVGATINLMLAASTAKGYSRLENAAMEPDVVIFGQMLQQMGAQIQGLGTQTIEIEGVASLNPVNFQNCPDRIELGTFMLTAAMAGKKGETISITQTDASQLGQPFIDAITASGVNFSVHGTQIDLVVPETILPVTVETGIFPGFPTDLQAQWTIYMAMANGNSKLRDTVYHDRFMHVPELHRMGVNAIVVGNEVVIEGNAKLQGTYVMSTDLRGSVALVMAGLVASGETHVLRIYHLDRGYENLEGKLTNLGAVIQRESYIE